MQRQQAMISLQAAVLKNVGHATGKLNAINQVVDQYLKEQNKKINLFSMAKCSLVILNSNHCVIKKVVKAAVILG